MNSYLKRAGVMACFIAIMAMNGGHWLVLQSVAWTRMIISYSQFESWHAALVDTFSGRHPCPLCLQITEGRQQEQKQEDKTPLVRLDKTFELFWEESRLTVPPAPDLPKACTALIASDYSDFIESPPTPPPRAGASWL